LQIFSKNQNAERPRIHVVKIHDKLLLDRSSVIHSMFQNLWKSDVKGEHLFRGMEKMLDNVQLNSFSVSLLQGFTCFVFVL